jgi:NADH:ubiquinone oxidoreductase subunit
MNMISQFLYLFSARHVGTDQHGNRYYQSRSRYRDGRKKRFVAYDGRPEASKVPAEWHGWLHHTEADPPPEGGYAKPSWHKEHMPNLTGTVYAYRPSGHLLSVGKRKPATGDYEAWRPEES